MRAARLQYHKIVPKADPCLPVISSIACRTLVSGFTVMSLFCNRNTTYYVGIFTTLHSSTNWNSFQCNSQEQSLPLQSWCPRLWSSWMICPVQWSFWDNLCTSQNNHLISLLPAHKPTPKSHYFLTSVLVIITTKWTSTPTKYGRKPICVGSFWKVTHSPRKCQSKHVNCKKYF